MEGFSICFIADNNDAYYEAKHPQFGTFRSANFYEINSLTFWAASANNINRSMINDKEKSIKFHDKARRKILFDRPSARGMPREIELNFIGPSNNENDKSIIEQKNQKKFDSKKIEENLQNQNTEFNLIDQSIEKIEQSNDDINFIGNNQKKSIKISELNRFQKINLSKNKIRKESIQLLASLFFAENNLVSMKTS